MKRHTARKNPRVYRSSPCSESPLDESDHEIDTMPKDVFGTPVGLVSKKVVIGHVFRCVNCMQCFSTKYSLIVHASVVHAAPDEYFLQLSE